MMAPAPQVLRPFEPRGPALFALGTIATGLVATFFDKPSVEATALLLFVPTVFGFFFVGTAAAATRSLPVRAEAVVPQRVLSLGWLAVLGALVLVGSIGVTAFQHAELLAQAPSFGLRAVATSLHPLLPLESRWIYSILPLFLLHPAVQQSRRLKAILWGALAFLVVLVQTKFAFLFFAGIATLATIGDRHTLSTKRLLARAMLVGAFVGLGLLVQLVDAPQSAEVVQDPTVALAPHPDAPELGSACREAPKAPYPTAPPGANALTWTIAHAPERLALRAFATPAAMYRLFLCLRERGWRPAYRGQQLARLVGAYVPFYRYAGREYREGFGSAVTSAVVAAPIDAYFNGGWLSVVAGALLAGLAYGFFARLARDERWKLWAIYGEVQLLVLLWQASVPTALVGVIPALALWAVGHAASTRFSR